MHCSDKIESKFALQAGNVLELNANVNCHSIDTKTGLQVCVPFTDLSKDCPKRTVTGTDTTCATVGAEFGLTAAWIKALNWWVDCNNIGATTGLCVGHI